MGGGHGFMNLVLMPYGLVIGLWVIWLVVYWRGGWDALHELAQAATRRDQLYLLGLVWLPASGSVPPAAASLVTPFLLPSHLIPKTPTARR